MYKHSIIDCYPRLLDEEGSVASAPPGTCDSSVSSNEGSPNGSYSFPNHKGSEGASDKISQDVLIFKKIAEIMPPKSLLHLLRGVEQTRSSHSPDLDACFQETFQKNKQKRRIRFVEHEDGHIKCQVFEVPRLSDPELWWQKEECSDIMAGCKSLAEHFLYYQDDYVTAIKRLMDLGGTSARRVEKAMECVARNSVCRGLESHIVRSCREVCKEHRLSVLRAQADILESLDDRLDDGLERIRQASCFASVGSKSLANRLAHHDAEQVGTAVPSDPRPGLDRWNSM